MDFAATGALCEMFCRRFSTLDLRPYVLRSDSSSDSVFIALCRENEDADISAAISVSEDTVRVLKINSFESLNTEFPFDTPLELFTNLYTLLMLCARAQRLTIDVQQSLKVLLGKDLRTWRELVIYICSLSPEEQELIEVEESHDNAVKFLNCVMLVKDHVLYTGGMYKSATPYKDLLECIRAVLDALVAIFKIHSIIVDPFFDYDNPDFTESQGFAQPGPGEFGMPPMGGGDVPPPIDFGGIPGGAPETGVPGEVPPLDLGSEGFPGAAPESMPPQGAPM